MRLLGALYGTPPLVDGSEGGRLMVTPPHNPGGGRPNVWHPPHPPTAQGDGETGAMIYENFDGDFDSVTTNGFVRVRASDGVLIIVPPTVDPVFAGALWVDGSTLKVSTGDA